jgi:hypothetical protein
MRVILSNRDADRLPADEEGRVVLVADVDDDA